MPTLKKIEENEFKGLTLSKKTFFVLGYTIDFLGDPKFPFKSQEERRSMWNECKNYIQKEMYKPRVHGNFRNSHWNSLRAEEYWRYDAPEPRKVLNGAKRIHPQDPDDSLWDSWPSEETEFEYLSRLNLLSDADRQFIKKYEKEFWDEENEERNFREYQKEMDKIETLNSKK
jgi:hypothetical protein